MPGPVAAADMAEAWAARLEAEAKERLANNDTGGSAKSSAQAEALRSFAVAMRARQEDEITAKVCGTCGQEIPTR